MANNLIDEPGESETYPLEWLQCQHCSLIQLSYVVPKEKLFDKYYYIPSVSKDHMKDFKVMAEFTKHAANLMKDDLVVDIGGSDGSLLRCFKELKQRVINVEPAKNIDTGDIPVIRKYFNTDTARQIVAEHGKAKLATMTNVFAHIDNLQEVIEALDILLDKDGVFFARFPDVRNLVEENQFDTIYHEHLSYFTVEPLHHLFVNTPFEIFDIDESIVHGGSMMIYVRRKQFDLKKFIESVRKIKHDLYKYVVDKKAEGKRIVGYG